MERETLTEAMERLGTPTIKAIAMVMGIAPERLYAVSKTPKEGVMYGMGVFNYDALDRFIGRRLDPNTEIDSMEALVANALIVDAELKAHDRRKKVDSRKRVKLEGSNVETRVFSTFEQSNNQYIVLKDDMNVYAIVYQTVSHTVMIPVKPDGTKLDESVKVISNTMLNIRGVSPMFLSAECAKRFALLGGE